MAKTGSKESKPKRQKKKVVVFTALNVAADPHPAGTYLKLFKRAEGRKRVKIAGDRMVEIGVVDDYNGSVLTGQIWSYTHVDRRKGVVNLRDRTIFTRAEVARLITAEFDERGVNHKAFWFGFDLATHTFVYEKKAMAPIPLAAVLEKILSSVMLDAGVSTLNVNVVQAAEALDRILELDLAQLTIRIARPNAPDIASLDERYRSRLANMHAKSETLVLDAEDGEPLKPDEETLLLAAFAGTNGRVDGRGYDSTVKRVVTRSTIETPMVHHATFDPKEGIDAEGFLADVAPNIGRSVRQRAEALQVKWEQREKNKP